MGAAEIVIALFLLAWIPALVICALKGRWVWFVLGLFFWLPAYIGAALSALPGSPWDRRSGGVKPCPRCAEEVRAAAEVCRYCGYEFGPPLTSAGA